MCMNYRGLNSVTIKNRYSLPLTQELLDRMKRARFFTKIDLRGAYNLVQIKKGEEWKTAFCCRYEHYHYLIMLFGLTNALATFQALINEVFKSCLDQYAVAYLDDIVVYSDTLKEHTQHVRAILERLAKANLFVQLEKCEFHTPETTFLGFIVGRGVVRMDSEKVAAVTDWPTPRTRCELEAFLGFANFYRQFIRAHSRKARGMTNLLWGKKKQFV